MARPRKFGALLSILKEKAKEGISPVVMKFSEIESLLGLPLPPSAKTHRAWWCNSYYKVVGGFVASSNTPPFSKKVWERAGFVTRSVDMQKQRVTFDLVARPRAMADESVGTERTPSAGMAEAARAYSQDRFHPAFGSMKGLIRIVAGTDLTKPADPDWGKVYDK